MTIRCIGKATTERVTCPECLSVLEYEPSDRVWFLPENTRAGSPVPFLQCTECPNQIRL